MRPVTNRLDLCDLLAELGYDGEGVELGAGSGWFSHHILNRSRLSRMYSVDPFDKPPGSEISFRADPSVYLECLRTLMPYEERSYVLRTLSNEAAKLFPDAAFDFVYIDANHWKPEVQNDIETWWPKVRPGGMLAGHDWCDTFHLDVREVVDKFVRDNGLTLHLTECDQVYDGRHVIRSWFFLKPRRTGDE